MMQEREVNYNDRALLIRSFEISQFLYDKGVPHDTAAFLCMNAAAFLLSHMPEDTQKQAPDMLKKLIDKVNAERKLAGH